MLGHGWGRGLKDVGDQALMCWLATAFPSMRPGLSLSYCGRRPCRSATNRLTGRPAWPHFRCCARCLFISNMVTFFFPNTGSSLASARISRRFAGFCSSCCLMYSQTLRTTSPRGRGPEPITAASSLDGCSGCCSPLGLPPVLFFDPVGLLLALVGMVVL